MDKLELGAVLFLLKSIKQRVGEALIAADAKQEHTAPVYDHAYVAIHTAAEYLDEVYRMLPEEEECGEDN